VVERWLDSEPLKENYSSLGLSWLDPMKNRFEDKVVWRINRSFSIVASRRGGAFDLSLY
jgi:hypothetical protein